MPIENRVRINKKKSVLTDTLLRQNMSYSVLRAFRSISKSVANLIRSLALSSNLPVSSR